jgi:hypothetical protein
MLVASSQSLSSVSDFRSDIFGPYDDEIFFVSFFAFLSIFVCAIGGEFVSVIYGDLHGDGIAQAPSPKEMRETNMEARLSPSLSRACFGLVQVNHSNKLTSLKVD